MIQQIEVTINAPLNPTELPERVVSAIEQLFPTAEFEIRDDTVIGTSHSLSRLSELLHQREILDTARDQFHSDLRPNGFSFQLKKQPAHEGIVTFVVGSPSELGEIDVDVRVTAPTPEEVIDEIAPPTRDGKPIDPAEHRR